MCLIIHKPANVAVPADLIANAWEDNPDGAGIMYLTDDGPYAYKVLPDAWADPAGHIAKVLSELEPFEVGIHFRWRTHGPVSEEMTHPYPLANGGLLMHNGVLPTGPGYTDAVSDTFYYINTHLTAPGMATDADYWDTVGKGIGGSKFLVLDPLGDFVAVNPKLWSGYKGLSLSNSHSIPELYNWKRSAGMGRHVRKYWAGSLSSGAPVDTTRQLTQSTRAQDNTTGLNGPLPNKLTRRERKVLRDCLRCGHWGPFDRLGRIGK